MASFRGIPPVGFVGTGGSLVQVLQKSADITEEMCQDVKCVYKKYEEFEFSEGKVSARERGGTFR